MLCPERTQASSALRLFMLCLLATVLSRAQAEQLTIRTYTTADGLVRDQINRIVQDSRGFLWFCTAEGLSRFDGYTFTNYTTDQGLPHRNVTDLLETRTGEYWIATNGGLVRFNPKAPPVAQVVHANEGDAPALPMFSVVAPGDDNRRSKAVTALFEE